MARAEKEAWVKDLEARFSKSAGMILADTRGLTVAQLTEIRRELKQSASSLHIVKNRLAKRALKECNIEGLDVHLKGPTAIAFATLDAVCLAKTVIKYVDQFEKLKVKAGYVGGRMVTADQVTALSKLPSRDQIFTQMVVALSGPARNLAMTLSGLAAKLVLTVKAVEQTKESKA